MRDAVSEEDFDRAVTESPVPVLLHFHRGDGSMSGDTLDAVAAHFGGALRVGSIVSTENPVLCRKLGIIAPTLILFEHGAERARRAGTQASADVLLDWLTPLVEAGCGCDRCRA